MLHCSQIEKRFLSEPKRDRFRRERKGTFVRTVWVRNLKYFEQTDYFSSEPNFFADGGFFQTLQICEANQKTIVDFCLVFTSEQFDYDRIKGGCSPRKKSLSICHSRQQQRTCGWASCYAQRANITQTKNLESGFVRKELSRKKIGTIRGKFNQKEFVKEKL